MTLPLSRRNASPARNVDSDATAARDRAPPGGHRRAHRERGCRRAARGGGAHDVPRARSPPLGGPLAGRNRRRWRNCNAERRSMGIRRRSAGRRRSARRAAPPSGVPDPSRARDTAVPGRSSRACGKRSGIASSAGRGGSKPVPCRDALRTAGDRGAARTTSAGRPRVERANPERAARRAIATARRGRSARRDRGGRARSGDGGDRDAPRTGEDLPHRAGAHRRSGERPRPGTRPPRGGEIVVSARVPEASETVEIVESVELAPPSPGAQAAVPDFDEAGAVAPPPEATATPPAPATSPPLEEPGQLPRTRPRAGSGPKRRRRLHPPAAEFSGPSKRWRCATQAARLETGSAPQGPESQETHGPAEPTKGPAPRRTPPRKQVRLRGVRGTSAG